MKELVQEGRKLCTVRKITDIVPIAGADMIELAIVDGWQTIIKKGEFKVGQYCIYYEIDSFLPADWPLYTFLLKSGVKKDEEGRDRIRLRSIKLKNEISQGLALPVHNVLNEDLMRELVLVVDYNKYDAIDKHTDDSVLEALEESRAGIEQFLDVTKYERPSERNNNGGGNAKTAGEFPFCIPKTDEERINNVYLKYSTNFKDVEFRPSLKLDGSSITVAYIDNPDYFMDKLDDKVQRWNEFTSELETDTIPYPYDFGDSQGIVCSRNLVLKHDNTSKFWMGVNNIDLMTNLKEYCDQYDRSLAIQGELMGVGIQGNRENFDKYEIFAFRIWDITNQVFLDDSDFLDVCSIVGVQTVPQFPIIKPFEKYSTLKEIIQSADIPSINHKVAEGIVFKSINKVNVYGKWITVHFKVINNRWLFEVED